MELRMPVMDGYEATRRIKGLRPGLPVVAVTASAFEDQEATVWAVGVDAFLRKPFRWEEFFGVLERVLGIEFEAAHQIGDAALAFHQAAAARFHFPDKPPPLFAHEVGTPFEGAQIGGLDLLAQILVVHRPPEPGVIR